ncbi:MAG: glycosyltransferase family 2 protein [Planctomycetes bacterium]|nr:glycosyltransferase family 2 protein [Planctomycetota bacterium]
MSPHPTQLQDSEVASTETSSQASPAEVASEAPAREPPPAAEPEDSAEEEDEEEFDIESLRGRGVVLIPAYNEEQCLGEVLDRIRASCPFDILIVDDGSVDSTARVARSHGATVVRHPFNMGYGAALQTGYKFASRRHYEVLVQIDADGQHDPAYIVPLARRILEGHSDACVGSRFLVGEGYIPPLARRAGMVLFGKIASIVTRRRVTDPTSGYQALSRRVFTFFKSDLFPADYPDADVLILLYRAGFHAEEIPVKMQASVTGQSMHGGIIRPLFYVFKMLLSICVTLLREPPDPERIPH